MWIDVECDPHACQKVTDEHVPSSSSLIFIIDTSKVAHSIPNKTRGKDEWKNKKKAFYGSLFDVVMFSFTIKQ